MPFAVNLRRIHYWLSLLVLATLPIVAVTGLLLAVKKEVAALQPPAREGLRPGLPPVRLDALLDAARGTTGLTWQDIDRIDVRPDLGIAKVILKSRNEVQVDLHSLRPIQRGYRASDWLETVHDFSFLGSAGKYIVSITTGAALLMLWGTGSYLFVQARSARRRRRARRPKSPVMSYPCGVRT